MQQWHGEKLKNFFFFLEIWKIFYIEISEERPVLLCFWPDRSCPLKNGKVTLLTSPKQVCAKAFDCVDHNKLWKILKQMGIPDHLTCLLRDLYAGQEATVRTGHGTTQRDGMGREEGGGFRMGNTCIPVVDSF